MKEKSVDSNIKKEQNREEKNVNQIKDQKQNESDSNNSSQAISGKIRWA